MTHQSPCPHSPRQAVRLWWHATLPLVAGLACASLLLIGCSNNEARPDSPPPGPTYTGPDYLRGTVGSLTRVRNFRPLAVSGYGLLVDLNGTGSREVPASIRRWMVNEMKKRGLGSTRFNAKNLTPRRVIADPNTAVVAVRGFIPPGASAGTRFDVVVSALQGTQTTSLASGRLYTTELSVNGIDPDMRYSSTLAKASGETFVSPFNRYQLGSGPNGARDGSAGKEPTALSKDEFVYHALVVGGGRVTESRDIQLVLNQPSWTRSRQITDRINQRFPAPPAARRKTARAKNDLLIKLNVPSEFRDQPATFLKLVQHLYTQQAPEFQRRQAERLGRLLASDPERSESVALAWQAMGKPAVEFIRPHYDAEALHLRLAALEAGAWLEDERASRYLQRLTDHQAPDVRRRVAEALVHLPRSLNGSRALKALLDDRKRDVRIAAYESLAAINDPILTRTVIRDRQGNVEFVLDGVPSERPLVYITQRGTPRIAIFQPELSFKQPILARIWDNNLMLRNSPDQEKMKIFYRPPDGGERRTFKLAPSLARLIHRLGHHAEPGDSRVGLGLSYSRVVDAVYQLCKRQAVPSPVEVRVSELAKRLEEASRVNIRQTGNARIPGRRNGTAATQPARLNRIAPPAGDGAEAGAGAGRPAASPSPSPGTVSR